MEDSSPAAPAGTLGSPGAADRSRRRGAVVVGVGVVVLAGLAVWHLTRGAATGPAAVDLGNLWDVVRDRATPEARATLTGSRIPRKLAGLLVGASLAVAGALFQTGTRNGLADSSTLGVSAGALLAVSLATTLGWNLTGLPRGSVALVGGLLAAALVFAIATASGATPSRLILTGAAVQITASAATGLILLLDVMAAAGLVFWGQGTLSQFNVTKGLQALPIVLFLVAAATAVGPRLDLLLLGDDNVRALGGHPGRARLATVAVGVVLTAVAVALAGPMAFVGLVAPHLARWLGVTRHRWLLPAAAVWGAVIVVLADGISQSVTATGTIGELPAGLTTALLGAPVLLVLARRAGAGGLDSGSVGTGGSRRPPRLLPLTARRGGWLLVGAAFVGVLVVVTLQSLGTGDTSLGWGQVVDALRGVGDPIAHDIVVADRLPRALVSILAGASFAVAGAVLQAVGRNPLAEPTVLGISGGAAVASLALLIAFPQVPAGALPLAAFAGGTLALVVVAVVAWRGGLAPERLLLVGVAVSAIGKSIGDLLVITSGPQLTQALVWLVGSTYGRTMTDVAALAPWTLTLIPLLWIAGRQLDLLALGDDAPRALGVHLDPTRIALLAAAVLLTSASIATVGAMGFIGLVGPHLARTVAGNDHRRLIPLAAVSGAAMVVVADLIGRTVIAPRQIPSGLVAALLGTPLFLLLLWRSGRRAPA